MNEQAMPLNEKTTAPPITFEASQTHIRSAGNAVDWQNNCIQPFQPIIPTLGMPVVAKARAAGPGQDHGSLPRANLRQPRYAPGLRQLAGSQPLDACVGQSALFGHPQER